MVAMEAGDKTSQRVTPLTMSSAPLSGELAWHYSMLCLAGRGPKKAGGPNATSIVSKGEIHSKKKSTRN